MLSDARRFFKEHNEIDVDAIKLDILLFRYFGDDKEGRVEVIYNGKKLDFNEDRVYYRYGQWRIKL